MRRSLLVVLVLAASSAGACTGLAACGEVLEQGPADGPRDEAGNLLESGTGNEGGSVDDASAVDAARAPFAIAFAPADPVVVAGAGSRTVTIELNRPPGDVTDVTLMLMTSPAEVTITGFPAVLKGSATSVEVLMMASAIAIPRKEGVVIRATTTTGVMQLGGGMVRIAHYYRDPGTFSFQTPSAQTYDVTAWGAGGASPGGGMGGFANAEAALGIGKQVFIVVGGPGGFVAGGNPGGGFGGANNAGGGGGYSGVFQGAVAFTTAFVVGGGGGGPGFNGATQVAGGAGGSAIGATAQGGGGAMPGGGGSAVAAGGNGGAGAGAGNAFQGGIGASGTNPGGGGGGGHYAGGGGATASGGGGGASFAAPGGSTLLGTNPASTGNMLRLTAGNPASSGAVLVTPK